MTSTWADNKKISRILKLTTIISVFLLSNLIITTLAFQNEKDDSTTRASYLLSSTDLISYYSEVAPSMEDANDPLWEHIEYITGSIPLHAPTGSTSVYLRSIYTDSDVYIQLSWKDLAKNTDGNYWVYDKGNWTFTSRYQDGLSLYFPINDPNNYFEEEGCMRTCHALDTEYLNPQNQQRKFTKTDSETGDIWFWQSSLTDPVKYAIDGYVNHLPSENNVGYYIDPDEDFGLVKNRPLIDYKKYISMAQPVFMQNPDIPPSYGELFIKSGESVPFDENYYDPDSGYSEVNPVTHEPWKDGDTVAGYMLDHLPTGEGDVSASSRYSKETQTWTLVLKRSIKTSDPVNDIQFDDISRSYLFGISVFGDLSGTSGQESQDEETTRCVPTKVSDTLSLRFQPIYRSDHQEEDPFSDLIDNQNRSMDVISGVVEHEVWDSAIGFRETLFDLNNKELGKTTPIGTLDIRSVYTSNDLYIKINWTIDFKNDLPRMELLWQKMEPVSMDARSGRFSVNSDNHLVTNSENGGDLWILPLDISNTIRNSGDHSVSNEEVKIDSGNNSQDVSFFYMDNSSFVIKRSLKTGDQSDLEFEDLTRVYTFSILTYGMGQDLYAISRVLSLRFDKNNRDLDIPPKVTGVEVRDGEDSNAVLLWDVSEIDDFGCYQIFYSDQEIDTIENLKPLTKISDADINSITINGLRPGPDHNFLIALMDDNRNINPASGNVKVLTTDLFSPPAIEGIEAEAGGDSDIVLQWDESRSEDFSSYHVYKSESPADIPDLEPSAVIEDQKESTYTLEGLLKGERYFVSVTAVDFVGNEDNPSIWTDVVVEDRTPPERITGLNAFDMANYQGGSIGLNWKASSSGDIDHYRIYMFTEEIEDIQGLDPHKTSNSTRVTIEGLDDLVKYYFIVTGVDINGHESESSYRVSATPSRSGPPEPVEWLRPKDAKDGVITLTWSISRSPYFDHYSVYISEDPDSEPNITDYRRIANITYRDLTTYNVTGLQTGVEYGFVVTVSNIHGIEKWDDVQSAIAISTEKEKPAPNYLLIILPFLLVIVLLIVVIVSVFFSVRRIRKFGSIRKSRSWLK